MDLAFNTEKLCFYSDIRKDELVKKLGAEGRIRDVGELMINYVKHFNAAGYFWYQDAVKIINLASKNLEEALKVTDDPESIELLKEINRVGVDSSPDDRYVPTILNFNDFRSIAYAVGTYRDCRGILRKITSKENPLDLPLQKYAKHYSDFKNGASLQINYFDENIRQDIIVAMDEKSEINSKIDSLQKVIQKASDYANRQGMLLRLSDLKDSVIAYYNKQFGDILERRSAGDMSWAATGYADDYLTIKDIDRVTGYFQRMAEINGLRFKLLNSTYLGVRGDSNPFEKTEQTHQKLLDYYNMSGFIHSFVK